MGAEELSRLQILLTDNAGKQARHRLCQELIDRGIPTDEARSVGPKEDPGLIWSHHAVARMRVVSTYEIEAPVDAVLSWLAHVQNSRFVVFAESQSLGVLLTSRRHCPSLTELMLKYDTSGVIVCTDDMADALLIDDYGDVGFDQGLWAEERVRH